MNFVVSLVSGTFGMITTIISGTFQLTCVVAAIGAFVAYNTKPKRNSFIPYITNKNSNNVSAIGTNNTGSIIGNMVKSVVDNVGIATSYVVPAFDYKDYVLFSLVEINDSSRDKYLGVFNNWFDLSRKNSH